jgi:hypothetical protein
VILLWNSLQFLYDCSFISFACFFDLNSRSDWTCILVIPVPTLNQQNVFRIKIFTDGINAQENICFVKGLCGICNSSFSGLGTKTFSCLLNQQSHWELLCNSISYNNLIGIRLNPLSIIQCFFISFTWLKFGSTPSNSLCLSSKTNKTRSSIILLEGYAVYLLYLFFLWRRNEKWFP